jgi:hypothetical protein
MQELLTHATIPKNKAFLLLKDSSYPLVLGAKKIGATPNKSKKRINLIHNHNIYHPYIPHPNIPDRLLQKQKLS